MAGSQVMNIPKATLSATQFRKYGAGGFLLDEQEAEQGCPRRYEAEYVSDEPIVEEFSYPLAYGSFFHRVLYLMQEGLAPDDALREAWDPALPQSAWTEAREDLDRYLSRGALPSDRYSTVGTEIELKALLYVDEEYGPIYYRGFLDDISLDLIESNVLHITDYKSNRQPPQRAALDGDVQMRGYHWLLAKNAAKWIQGPVRIVTHYDAIKFREVSTAYTEEQIEDWETWAIAVARKILRDREFLPVINPGCPNCPVRMTCPAYAGLPDVGALTITNAPDELASPEALLAWRNRANATRLLLEKAVKDVDARVTKHVRAEGELVVSGLRYVIEFPDVAEIDLRRLHEVLGDEDFYRAVSTSKTAIDRVTKRWDTERLGEVQTAITYVPGTPKMKKYTIEKRDQIDDE